MYHASCSCCVPYSEDFGHLMHLQGLCVAPCLSFTYTAQANRGQFGVSAQTYMFEPCWSNGLDMSSWQRLLVQEVGLCQVWVVASRDFLTPCPSCMTDSCIAVAHHGLPLRLLGASTQPWNEVSSVVAEEAQHVQGCQHLPLNNNCLIQLHSISHGRK